MSDTKIITSASLNDFFYSTLSQVNKKSPCPIPEEFIFYSSLTLENYAKVSSTKTSAIDSVLGLKYLNLHNKTKLERLRELKNIGDSILIQLGLFSGSKIQDRSYYLSLAKNSYEQLDSLNSGFYDIPDFYKLFATSLERTIVLLELLSEDLNFVEQDHYLLNLNLDCLKAS
jgi:hypothetical protein